MTIRAHLKKWPVLSGLSMFFLGGTIAGAQSTTAPNPQFAQDQDRDITRKELANFDEFLDSHREIAEQVRKDPSLLDSKQFLKDHPELQKYLWNHPGVREEVKENPTAFMHQENRYDRQEDAAVREKLASFDRFLDSHREISERVRKNPSLLDDEQFLKEHPELQAYLQEHTGVRNAVRANPTAFMREEQKFDQREDAGKKPKPMSNATGIDDHDTTRGQLASFDQFLDKHRETAEQLRNNPSLASNQQFLKEHPALQSYLADHPAVREQLRSDPNAFMQQEARYDRREDDMNRGTTADRDSMDRDRGNGDDRNRNNGYDRDRGRDFDRDRDAHRHFGEFLANHGYIAQQLSHDPSSVTRQDYLRDHPELQDYLNQHPEVRHPLMADPQNFVNKSTQQFTNGQPVKSPATTAPTTPPTTGTPKPNKQ